uniref:Protein NO VEIN C-terminal domain-containing protein n=1 Tax=Cryptomonas curvata TaxID=233186 RepID=A0A7S0MIB1_9CRYP|mmetsp:Transcript_42812/g.89532  ORF Transcript_42812/g.89532 Transcript_42812/m.89532 type:complete len:1888 (+) Transcript_42812:1798-7461(+)
MSVQQPVLASNEQKTISHKAMDLQGSSLDIDDSSFDIEDAKMMRVISEQDAKAFVSNLHNSWDKFKFHRKAMCKCLEHLGPALYPSSGHFISELIQNADDCLYSDIQLPKMKIYLADNYMLISKNEVGFVASDVFSVCSIGESTKSQGSCFIGHKGIGFKAVFAASKSPTIISIPWYFGFVEGADEIDSFVTPRWLDVAAREKLPDLVKQVMESHKTFGSLLYLPYHSQMQSMVSEGNFHALQFVDPVSLLFLNKIKCIEVVDMNDPNKSMCAQCEELESEESNTIKSVFFEERPRLSKHIINCSGSKFPVTLVRLSLSVPNSTQSAIEAGNLNPKLTEICVCFPLESESRPLSSYSVFAHLPVSKLGFPFKVQANWILSTNRESVEETQFLNLFLRNQIAALVAACLTSDVLHNWIHFIPELHPSLGGWWSEFVHQVHGLVKAKVFDRCFPFHKQQHESFVMLRSDGPDLLEIMSADDLRVYGGYCVLSLADYGSHLKDIIHKIPSLGEEFESLSIMHVLKSIPDKLIDHEGSAKRHKEPLIGWDKLFEFVCKSKDSKSITDLCKFKPIVLIYGCDLQMKRGSLSSCKNAMLIKPEQNGLLPVLHRTIRFNVVTLVGYASDFELNFLESMLHVDALDIQDAILQICTLHFRYHLEVKSIPELSRIVNADPFFYEELDTIIHELIFLFENKESTERILIDQFGAHPKSSSILWIPVESPPFSVKDNTKLVNSARICSASDERPIFLQTVLGIPCSSNKNCALSDKNFDVDKSSCTGSEQMNALRHPQEKLFCNFAIYDSDQSQADPQVPPLKFDLLPQRVQRTEFLKWESLLAWAGSQSPLHMMPTSPTRDLNLQNFLDELHESVSDFVSLVGFHSDEAMAWFRRHLQFEIYLDEKLNNHESFSYLSRILPTIKVPGYLSPEFARKLGIHTEIHPEDMDMFLRVDVNTVKSSSFIMKSHRQLLFTHLNAASEETSKFAAGAPIFILLNGSFGCLCGIKYIFVCDTAVNIALEELSALAAARRNKLVELVVAESDSEKNFLCKHFTIAGNVLDPECIVKIIVQNHLEIYPEICLNPHLFCFEVKELQAELCFLYQHKGITIKYLRQGAEILSDEALLKKLWVPVYGSDVSASSISIQSPALVGHITVSSVLSLTCLLNVCDFEYLALGYEGLRKANEHDAKLKTASLLSWELTLLWLGCKPPVNFKNNSSEKVCMQSFLCNVHGSVSDLVSLIEFHPQETLDWFCKQLEYAIYLDKKILDCSAEFQYVTNNIVDQKITGKGQSREIYLSQFHFSSLFLNVPESLNASVAAKIAIHSCAGFEVVNEVLRFVLGCRTGFSKELFAGSRPLRSHLWDQYQWEAFFNHLQHAPDSVVNDAATKAIFLDLCSKNCADNQQGNRRVAIEGRTAYFSKNRSEELKLARYHSDHYQTGKSKVVFIGAESDAEECFLKSRMNQCIVTLDIHVCIQLVLQSRLHRKARPNEKQNHIFSEIVFLFKNKELVIEHIKSYNDDTRLSDYELLQNLKSKYPRMTEPLILKQHHKADSSFKQALLWLYHSDPEKVCLPLSTVQKNLTVFKFQQEESGEHKVLFSGAKGNHLKAEPWTVQERTLDSFWPTTAKGTHPEQDVQCHGSQIKQQLHDENYLLPEADVIVSDPATFLGNKRSDLPECGQLDTGENELIRIKRSLWTETKKLSFPEHQLRRERIGKTAELFVFKVLSQLSLKSGREYSLENWVSSASKELRFEAGVCESSIDDGLGYDFVIESSIFFSDSKERKKKTCRIEVKGSEKNKPEKFFVSSNELGVMSAAILSEEFEYVVLIVSNVIDNQNGKPSCSLVGYIDSSKFLSCKEIDSPSIQTRDGLVLIPQEYMVPFNTCEANLCRCSWFDGFDK